MVTKLLICYKFINMKPADRNKFKRKLFGAEEKTHGGRYIAKTKGYLSDKQYEKPVNSVIIIDKHHKQGIIKILKSFNAKINIYSISN